MEKSVNIKTSLLLLNSGKIEGLPKNPRFIRDERFEALKKSISEAPEMLEYRTLLVYPYNKKFVVICGNMRLRALKELGHKEVLCCVLPSDTPINKLKEYTIKDNVAFGDYDWDALANDWEQDELEGWGMELDFLSQEEDDLTGIEDDEKESEDSDMVKVTFEFPKSEWENLKAKLDVIDKCKEVAVIKAIKALNI